MKYTVKNLFIYPIKSLGGISLSQSQVLPEGLLHDRKWMLIDKDGKFLTQRENANLALFKTTLENDGIKVHYRGDTLLIPFDTYIQKPITTAVWDTTSEAHWVGEKYNVWFSEKLDQDVILLTKAQKDLRVKTFKLTGEELPVHFADAYPLTIVSQQSLDYLNSLLEEKIDMDRFRPNIVIEVASAHEEDTWSSCTVGNIALRMLKPCARCVMTTIDQATGEKGKEPLKTLHTYRKVGNKINFSMNAVSALVGNIHVGDLIADIIEAQ